MAKKAGKRIDPLGGEDSCPALLRQVYPTIARWASGYGRVEFGIDGRDRPFVRAQDEGGTVWEGEGKYRTLDEALGALEAGLAGSLEEEGFNGERGGSVEKEAIAASGEKSKTSRKASSERDARVETQATAPAPRAVVEKVRKFAEIAEALRRGQHFEITRLTGLKGFCKDPRAARSFALFLAVQARERADEKDTPERFKDLMDGAITEMESYVDDLTGKGKERLYPLLREMEREQDEHERIGRNMVRVVHSRELLVVEKAMKSILREAEAPTWLYQAARDYCERYDSRYGTGLIPASAPMMRAIAEFWRDFHGIER